MKTPQAIGIMSGTSVDSIDAALIEITGTGDALVPRLIKGISYPIPLETRREIFRLFEDPAGSLEGISVMNIRLGELFTDAVRKLIAESGVDPADVSVIGSHGQTIYHVAEPIPCCGGNYLGTLQIGEGSVIAQGTGIRTVSDFRTADIAAGGTGAPLVPFLDSILARTMGDGAAFLNLGGIANVSFIPRSGEPLIAFDTGPANMIVDRLVEEYTQGERGYDEGGTIGAKGSVKEELLARWMTHPYLKAAPPKSTGRELFGTLFFREYLEGLPVDANLIRTAEEYTARTVAHALKYHLPEVPRTLVVTGGGTHNPVIMEGLAKLLPETTVITGEAAGISIDYKEAVAFALMAYFSIQGWNNNVPSATGASRQVVMGKISLP